MKKGKLFLIIGMLASMLAFGSCSQDAESSTKSEPVEEVTKVERKGWTVMVYMAADNNLESYALADINEMEKVKLPDGMHVLVLLDRAPGFDATNSDWTGTRLYDVQYDRNGTNKIVSHQLDCEKLSLSDKSETELDMADKNTLKGFMEFAYENYLSENYALVIWGNGGIQGYASDDYSGKTMSLGQLRQAINDGKGENKLDVIGFDTCFGMNSETLYELKGLAQYAYGTAGLLSEDGMNYEYLLKDFAGGAGTPKGFCESALNSFRRQYEDFEYASFCAVNLSAFGEVVESFDEACKKTAPLINSEEKRVEFKSMIQDQCQTYTGVTYPCDCYVDLYSLADNLAVYDEEIESEWNLVKQKIENSMELCWNGKKMPFWGTGVFYSTYAGKKFPDTKHPQNYVWGNGGYDQSKFVNRVKGWVPTADSEGSILDRLFYTVFTTDGR